MPGKRAAQYVPVVVAATGGPWSGPARPAAGRRISGAVV